MYSRPWRTGIGFFIAVAVGLAGGVKADIPGADNPKAFTEHQYRAQLEKFNRRTLVDAYQQVGHHDPKWDKPAIALLEDMAVYFSQANAGVVYRTESRPLRSEMEALGRKALAAGCDDPLVVDMFCVTLHDGGKIAEMTPLVRQAADHFVSSHYPIYRAANCIRRAMQTVDVGKEPKLHQKYDQMLYDAALATVKFTHYQGLDRRFVYQILARNFESWPVQRKGAFYQALVAAKADPWMTNLFGGIYHARAAWQARGYGWANTVTEAGWRGMRRELKQARACLTQAYALQPTYPEAATNMITVVMGEGETPQETLRLWFNRAVEGQFDYDPAYINYLYALLPRWDGNYEMMYDFGLECAKTARYDTRVPFNLVRALENINRDDNGSWAFWRKQGVLDALANTLSHYGDSFKSPQLRETYYSQIVGYAWQLGRYDVGRSMLDKIGGHYNRAGLVMTRVLPTRTASGTYAMTGPHAAALKQAERNVVAGQFDPAIATYEKTAKALPAHDHEHEWVLGRSQELKWLKQFEAGQWVNLTPDNQLDGWSIVAGDFHSDGRQLKGTRDAFGAQLVCGCKFGQRLELTATVTMDSSDTSASAPDGGILFYWCGFYELEAITVCPGRQKAIYRVGADSDVYPRKVGPIAKYHVWLFDGHVEVSIDGRTALPYNELGVAESPDSRLAVGSLLKRAGGSFTISDLKVHKLTERPAHWPADPSK